MLILIFSFTSCLNAETELSSDKNRFPFKYKPTPQIELTVSRIKNDIYVTYPNKVTQKIITLEENHIKRNSPSVTEDLNFDGYTDLAISVEVNPRGLNEGYIIFLWDNKKQKLKKSAYITNPSIEEEYLVSNNHGQCVIRTICTDKIRYKWEGNKLITHSTYNPLGKNKIEISFYKDENITKTIVVSEE